MPGVDGRLILPDPRCEMMVCYSDVENQSLPVLKKVQLGEFSRDALSQHSICISWLKLHESYVCSSQSTFVRVNEFHSFIVSSDYLLLAARNAQAKHAKANHGKRLKGGEPVAVLRDALIEPPRQFAIQHLHSCIKHRKVTFYVSQPTRVSRR